jgi:hypothetical protein
MISDLDAYRAAALLMKQHGDDAEVRAAERADKADHFRAAKLIIDQHG